MGRGSCMTIVSDIIEGIIAGLTGAFTAVISVHLQNGSKRRFEHHLKHKENFEVLMDDIRDVCSKVYPYIIIGNKEKPFISKNYEVDNKFWEHYSIFSYQKVIQKDEKTYEIIHVDSLLYNDIKNHWSEFYNKLNGWNQKIKEIGNKSNEIMKVMFDTIHKLIMESDVKTICTQYENYPQRQERYLENYELVIYNFVMDTKPDEWPNLYSSIKQAGITDQLKKLAQDVRSENKKELQYFYDNIYPFLKDAGTLIQDLDELIHKEKIKHTCEYIK